MAAAVEASLLPVEGALHAGFLLFLRYARSKRDLEEMARAVVKLLRGPFAFPNRAGHKKGRFRSSRPEEDCL